MLIPAIIGVGILLSVALVLASPLQNSWAQQQQQQQQLGMNETTDASQYGAIPKINGSVNVREGVKNFFVENAKTPFITAAQTAQSQIANGLTYTYFVANPTNDTAHIVIVDAGNGRVLYTSEGKQIGSWDQPMFGPFGHGSGGHEGFGGTSGFGPFRHGFGPFHGSGGFRPFEGFWHDK